MSGVDGKLALARSGLARARIRARVRVRARVRDRVLGLRLTD